MEFMNYSQYRQILYADMDSPWGLLTGIVNTWTAAVGPTLFWMFILSMPMIAFYIMYRSVIVPAVAYMLIATIMFFVMPVQMMQVVYALLVLSIAGIIYHALTNR